MKLAIAVLLFAISALAQDQPALKQAESACGPANVNFDAQASTNKPPEKMETGKAIVYVTEVFQKAPGEMGNPTLRVGLDGTWMGATRSNSYVSFSVNPGEHHLCTNWQSHFKRLSREAAFTSFTAEAGKRYYFRARVTYNSAYNGTSMSLDLEPINPDEGQFLVASNGLSVSHPKSRASNK